MAQADDNPSADYRALYQHTSDALLVLQDGCIVDCNPAALALFECNGAQRLPGRNLADLSPLQQTEGVLSTRALADLQADALRDGNRRFEWCWVGCGGRQFWADVVLTALGPQRLCAAIRDISARKQEQLALYLGLLADVADRRPAEQTRHLAEHDFLTDLPNRVLLLDRLTLALAAARRRRSRLALLFLDLDRFKNINDTLGHHVGDRLLQEVALRLRGCVRSVDTVSRQGGDEFVIILPEIGGIDQVAHVAAAVLNTLGQEFVLEPYRLNVGASIGISIFPDDGADLDTLVRHADLAMYHAKENGGNGFQFFSAEMNALIVERAALENDLQRALRERQFVLEYEAQVDLASGLPLAAEALLRWRHPTLGLLRPERFIGVAEACGLMVPIGQWVLEQACREARRWQQAGHALAVAVNLSPTQFLQKDLAAGVDRALAAAGLAPELLELELTEAVIMQHGAAAPATLGALRQLGVRLAIDDFGTGYTRIGHLREYPFNKLKIDRTFIGDIDGAADGATPPTVVTAIIAMARSLDLTVLAEGVETEAQLRFLAQHGCHQVQGYYVRQNGWLDGLDGLLDGA
ncbi:bifunctional diguanylate cyclase/phosphodiesterase [Duganella sp. HH101]|uniref:putative bifunctional diguanylate cyclase/phosphodiesterase n=1 Tax=Duganella sp. HH101 TaxID=1781066 RepID=UPI0008758DBE|nr:EAL domain-containing protein [Duganella sp. HH101]OFA02649.1 phytochrome-like protein cph2 [Duganella sp. HH101]